MSSVQVQNVSAAHIMKCDDDTFVRVDAVLKEINNISPEKSLYMGNLNLLHRPLRTGKWAVTFEVFFYFPFSFVINFDIGKGGKVNGGDLLETINKVQVQLIIYLVSLLT